MDFQKLPIYQHKNDILAAIARQAVIIVESPTGSGKTTQLPLILYEAGYAMNRAIGVTQPRRIATLSVCDFIAKQLNSPIGGFVGYKMRFEDQTTAQTMIKIMTDGTLLQEIKADPLLERYSVIIIDEAHERSLTIDFILGLLKNILSRRTDLKVIISSATINTALFSQYFYETPIIKIDSETFPVQTIYAPTKKHNDDLIAKTTSIVEQAIHDKRRGDILVFLSGEALIKACALDLSKSLLAKKLKIMMLYARQDKEEQKKVFVKSPRGLRKVVIATNIAETSITIDGIGIVIDSGIAKINYYNPDTFTSSLLEKDIDQSSADQRKGRAGRTAPGVCYRLYKRSDFLYKERYALEEIKRTDLTEVVLRMAEIGIKDFEDFDFISPPDSRSMQKAVETLQELEALDEQHQLTAIGQMMGKFPLSPRHSRMLVEAMKLYPSVIHETIIVATFLSSNSPFILVEGEELAARKEHSSFGDARGDFFAYIRLYENYSQVKDKQRFCKKHYLDLKTMSEISNIVEQLAEIVNSLGVPIASGGSDRDLLLSCCRGLSHFICIRTSKGKMYQSLTSSNIIIHPGSVVFRRNPDLFVAGEIMRTNRTYARSVSPIKEEWLELISPRIKQQLKESRNLDLKSLLPRVTKNEFKVGTQSFPIVKRNQHKIIIFAWEKLLHVIKDLDIASLNLNLHADLYFGKDLISAGLMARDVFYICTKFNPYNNIRSRYPKVKYDISARADLNSLIGNLVLLGNIYAKKRKKNSGYKTSKKKTNYSFIGIDTDGEGQFWFIDSKQFTQLLEHIKASLNILSEQIESLENSNIEPILDQVNIVYKHLSNY